MDHENRDADSNASRPGSVSAAGGNTAVERGDEPTEVDIRRGNEHSTGERLTMRRNLVTLAAASILLGLVAIFVLPSFLGDTEGQPRPRVTAEQIKGLLDKIDKSETVAERWAIVDELTKGGRDAIDLIKNALEAQAWKPTTRIAALRALSDIGSRNYAAGRLIEATTEFDDLDARREASAMLQQVCTTAQEGQLVTLLEKVFDPDVKINVCLALYLTCKETTRSLATLRQLMTSDMTSTRLSAALAYGMCGRASEVDEQLYELSQEPSQRGRLAAQLLKQHRLQKTLEQKMLGGDGNPAAQVDSGGIEDPEVATRIAEEVLLMIKERAAVSDDKLKDAGLLRAAAESVLKSLDPYSSYVPDKETAEHARVHEATLGTGRPFVGIIAGKPGSFIRVIAAVEGSPAWRAGIRPLDTISKINGKEVYERTLVEIDTMFHGAVGETCEVEIIRDGWFVPRTYHLKYEEVSVPAARGESLPGGIGYLRVPVCVGAAAAQAKAALEDLASNGATSLVLDLRGNPGGSMDVALALVDLFLDADKLVCYSEGRNKAIAKRTDLQTKAPAATKLPMTVLVDRGTASAAEVVAGALQAHKRATIVGHLRASSIEAMEPSEDGPNGVTFGKALMQAVVPLNFRGESAGSSPELVGSYIKLTVGHYFLPGDVLIHERGITADVRAPQVNMPGWEMDELDKPAVVAAIDDYLKKLLAGSQETFAALAAFDGRKAESWPGLAELRTSSGCMATPERLRQAVRMAARKLVGITAPDAQDDPAVFAAIGAALKANGQAIADVPEYARLQAD